MRRLCIAAYQGRSWFPSRIIRWRSWSVYSHVAWIEPDGCLIDAWCKGGVRRVATLSEGHTPGTKVDLFSVELTDEQVAEISAFLTSQIGKGYDWAGAFGFLFRVKMENRTKWFCSELLGEAFLRAGCMLMGCPVWKLSPGDVTESPLVRLETSTVTV